MSATHHAAPVAPERAPLVGIRRGELSPPPVDYWEAQRYKVLGPFDMGNLSVGGSLVVQVRLGWWMFTMVDDHRMSRTGTNVNVFYAQGPWDPNYHWRRVGMNRVDRMICLNQPIRRHGSNAGTGRVRRATYGDLVVLGPPFKY